MGYEIWRVIDFWLFSYIMGSGLGDGNMANIAGADNRFRSCMCIDINQIHFTARNILLTIVY